MRRHGGIMKPIKGTGPDAEGKSHQPRNCNEKSEMRSRVRNRNGSHGKQTPGPQSPPQRRPKHNTGVHITYIPIATRSTSFSNK